MKKNRTGNSYQRQKKQESKETRRDTEKKITLESRWRRGYPQRLPNLRGTRKLSTLKQNIHVWTTTDFSTLNSHLCFLLFSVFFFFVDTPKAYKIMSLVEEIPIMCFSLIYDLSCQNFVRESMKCGKSESKKEEAYIYNSQVKKMAKIQNIKTRK